MYSLCFYIIHKKFNVFAFYRSDTKLHYLRNKVTMNHMLTHTVYMKSGQLKPSKHFESSKL